ncbi:MAG: glycosyltransferase family 2 protein [Chitinispirillaceae bacterium]
MNNKIDIIIPTLDRPCQIQSLVESLKPMLARGDTITIVWQGSEKPEIACHPDIRLYYLPTRNLPTARNFGIRKTSGDIILFLDDDIEVESNLLHYHRNGYEDQRVGAVSGFIEDPLFPSGPDKLPKYNTKTGEIIQNFSSPEQTTVISLMGAQMSFRRTALEKIEGFDEQYKGNALWEDVDCAFRLRAAGYMILYEPNARVKHIRESTGGCRFSAGARYVFYEFYNTTYFAARFAPTDYLGSWVNFWWHRLEYRSRKKFYSLKHSPIIVAAGILGACHAIAGYCLAGKQIPGPDTYSSFRAWAASGE